MNERITFKKERRKLQIVQQIFGLQLARAVPVLEAGGKPSTRFALRRAVQNYVTRFLYLVMSIDVLQTAQFPPCCFISIIAKKP